MRSWIFGVRIWLVLLVAVGLLAGGCMPNFIISIGGAPSKLETTVVEDNDAPYNVLILPIEGFISAANKDYVLGEQPGTVALVKEQLKKAAADESVKAIVLRVNSPGGGVTASDIIYNELKQFQERTGKPIVGCMMDVATSGAYYISVASKKIIAHPTTLTGSIGVLMQLVSVDKLLEKLGITPVTIKSREYKDAGSPFKPLTEDEKEIFQKITESMFQRFVTVVSNGRGLKRDEVLRVADGRAYEAIEAKQLKLIDRIGYIEDAVSEACQLAGLKKANIIMYKRTSEYRSNIYAGSGVSEISRQLEKVTDRFTVRFLYLWSP